MENNNFTLRIMQIEDYENVYKLWMTIDGFGIRSIDDSKEGVARFLKRNPSTSVVAEADGKIVGAILCGHDGRRGCFYHVCVRQEYRKHGIGKAMMEDIDALAKAFGCTDLQLRVYPQNDEAVGFYQKCGFTIQNIGMQKKL